MAERQGEGSPLFWGSVVISNITKTYRVYWFDAVKGALGSELIDALSDEEAIALAERTGFGNQCELWQQDRLVAKLPAGRIRP